MLTAEIENAEESDLEQLAQKFPRGGAIGILTNHPELHLDCKLTRYSWKEQILLKQKRDFLSTEL